ncbi:MAG TPA: homoserine O-succinyltransferase [Gammaproteobacteria bacterium]|jgi:homoserine O-succinyltransferase|nr:homoserine O-succinyltransferase [Gammaproteobacteria bacterium]HIK76819.1 homoserine O-succinyltransferase [Gammaproteobacteria bacterium]
MPVVAHPKLPSLDRLIDEGLVLSIEDSKAGVFDHELNIGLLNLMPDAALEATERQFIRLLASREDTLVHVYPTTVDVASRGEQSQSYISQHYNSMEDFMVGSYDGLIISGANPSQADMTQESFWDPLIEVMEWGEQHTHSILCSCLATHALMKAKYGINRQLKDAKSWGVFPHELINPDHPLVKDITGGLQGPHSHYYDLPINEIEQTNLQILALNQDAGFFLASTPKADLVLFQGHPEYDDKSLMKEYEREIKNFLAGLRSDYPNPPKNYFSVEIEDRLEQVKANIQQTQEAIKFGDEYLRDIDLSWIHAGKTIYRNWLGLLLDSKPKSIYS